MPKFGAALIIPTGIGARVGGFGGDATREMNLIAGVVDTLITHPNVANAAAFQNLPDNTHYVEGYALDQFFLGHWHLQPVISNRIGVVFDAGIEPRMLTLHQNTLNAVQSVYGTDIVGFAVTDEPLRMQCGFDPSGSSSGEVHNPETLLRACETLIARGATALAICAQMPELDGETLYKEAGGVDPVGGIEALLSHCVVSHFKLPCAHAPVFREADAQPEMEKVLDPRTAPEYIVSTFLPCVLTGLQRAPQFTLIPKPGCISRQDVHALVVPADALGSVPVLSALNHQIRVIAVRENTTVMDVGPQELQPLAASNYIPILEASTYYEAAGMLQAMKLGYPVPWTRTAPVPRITSEKRLAMSAESP